MGNFAHRTLSRFCSLRQSLQKFRCLLLWRKKPYRKGCCRLNNWLIKKKKKNPYWLSTKLCNFPIHLTIYTTRHNIQRHDISSTCGNYIYIVLLNIGVSVCTWGIYYIYEYIFLYNTTDVVSWLVISVTFTKFIYCTYT